jgi:hypothetical protein
MIVGPAAAQQAQPAKPAAPAAGAAAAPQQPTEFPKDHLAAAKAAIDATHQLDNLDSLLVGITLQAKATFTKANPSQGAVIDEVTNKVAIDLAARRPELDKQIQTAWASHFTKPELEDLTKFLNSNTGKKWLKELPAVSQQMAQAIQTWQKSINDEMMAKTRDELVKRGVKL